MKIYATPEGLMRAIQRLCQEKRRLRAEAIRLKAQHDEVARRFRDGALDGDKARALAYAIHDRLELILRELMPLVERRANELTIEYVNFVRNDGGPLPSFGIKRSASMQGPAAGDELKN